MRLLIPLVVLTALTSCGTKTQQAVGETPALKQARTLTGTVEHVDIESGRKSVSAYLNEEFLLKTSDGESLVLRPTSSVSREQLLTWVGKSVVVSAEYSQGKAPDPMMQAPMGADGQAMAQGVGWLVNSIAEQP
ncbi:MAG: hypothetical protein ACI9MC_003708 [Kiritimatiellia bacterium]|jgi:hypothetical protein